MGPGRPRIRSFYTMVPQLMFILYISSCFTITVSCSSRSTPNRPRPTTIATTRPNITFQTYACPEAYAKWYCLNGATCFAVKIRDSILYNCECADGYMGQRCEFKDLDGSYLPSREREIQTAGIAGGVLIIVAFIAFIYLIIYLMKKSRRKYNAYYPKSVEEGISHCLVQQHTPSMIPDVRTKTKPFQSESSEKSSSLLPEALQVATVSQSPYLEHFQLKKQELYLPQVHFCSNRQEQYHPQRH
ncbi:uncharacterized protein [Parasteatoda tepidariorum]|uniref:uncharacterized protein isoform X2 n=1 Tax=Parasteatoda tepidariorum TaxID=114398 RepID=UPI001C71EECC|nr:pro-epidermal growth factor isoform X2 [Parasteatoda tepidariorum]